MALGWAIIGTGLHPHLKIAPAMAISKGADLVAVYSRDRDRAEAFAAEHRARAAYDSVDDLLKDSRVEAVFVASPNYLHAEQTIKAAGAGKQVLAEKPMATTVDDAAAMVRACREHGVKLGTGFHSRYHPGHIMGRDLVAKGTLGPIRLAQSQWGRGVRGQRERVARTGLHQWWEQPELIGDASTMMGSGVHALDLLRFMLGQEVTEVAAITDGQTTQQPLEHLAALALRFDGGTIATVICGRNIPDTRNDFDLYGTDGRVSGTSTLWEERQGIVEVISETLNQKEVYPNDALANYIDQLDSFQQAVERDEEPTATGIDGLQVVRVTSAMIESARTGRTIKLETLSI